MSFNSNRANLTLTINNHIRNGKSAESPLQIASEEWRDITPRNIFRKQVLIDAISIVSFPRTLVRHALAPWQYHPIRVSVPALTLHQ